MKHENDLQVIYKIPGAKTQSYHSWQNLMPTKPGPLSE